MSGADYGNALDRLTKETLLKHKIKVLDRSSDLDLLDSRFRIKLLSAARQGTIAEYHASFNQYRIYVRLLNLSVSKKKEEMALLG